MADTICASQGPHNPRLRPNLLDKQQVAVSGFTVTTNVDSPVRGECAQGGAQLIIDAAQAHWHLDLLGRDERDVHIRAIPHKGKPGRAFNGNFAMDLENFQAHNNNGYGLYLQSRSVEPSRMRSRCAPHCSGNTTTDQGLSRLSFGNQPLA